MNILFLTQILPYPPNAGPRVKTWHVLRHLADSGANITLVTFIRPEEYPYLPEVEKVCQSVIPVPIDRGRFTDLTSMVKALIKGEPFLVERDNQKAMRTILQKVAQQREYDVIHADQLTMAQHALYAREQLIMHDKPIPYLLFDAHNATWTLLARMEKQVPPFLKPAVHHEMKNVKRYEYTLCNLFDQTLAVTEIDRKALLDAGSGNPKIAEKIDVIPIAVDTKTLKIISPRKINGHQIITMGTLHYPPNADGIRWFMKEVFPLIAEKDEKATLTIIGKNPPADFYQLAKQIPGKIEITGYVENLEPYLEKAAVMVVPVLAGGGMRVRILEAFARELPVVTTTIGLEGIEAAQMHDVIIADKAEDFAKEVLTLINNPDHQQFIAKNGRLLVEKKYDWKVVFKSLDRIYSSAITLRKI